MRRWYKPEIAPTRQSFDTTLDRSFDEHQRAIGGYPRVGYESAEQFFRNHLAASPRHLCYQQFLAAHLPKDGRILSIAGGRAVNEMRLVADGYHVVCSDLEPVWPDETRRLFPGYRFMRWDVLNDPIPAERFDAVMCLGFIYLLDHDGLSGFFGRVSELLRPEGVFVLDAAGSSPDSLLANLLHEVYLPGEAWLVCGLKNIVNLCRQGGSNGRMVVRRKHHGYRYGDREIVAAAAEEGLKVEAVEHMDFETEWTRSRFYNHCARRVPPLRRGLLAVGRMMPYVRMFAFRRAA